ncbi:GmrSD restriction endonuclease domain-containing protein [Gryllotalpicola koreensis]|uniref:GmrSD restriction endonuclease domain-containing protein n=1 Tax=Gryllotalpicola koreensis TaxID=993086 RepID=UPI0031D7F66E
MASDSGTIRTEYRCDDCGYVFSPADYSDDFDSLPTEWTCPQCQAGKDHFQVVVPPTNDLEEENHSGEVPDEAPDPSGPRRLYTSASTPDFAGLQRRWKKGALDTQPDFQRYEVWSDQKKSALIESILLDLPIPQVFLAQDDNGKAVVIDGQQRLTAVFRYLDGDFALKLANPRLTGKRFKDLSEELQTRIEDAKISVVEVLKESDPEIRYLLFQRLNEGSVSLNDQELRNSVFRGPYNDFIKELASEKTWLKLLGLKERHKRMVDVELVLRYMAFREQTYLKHPDKKTGKFLDRQMTLNANPTHSSMEEARKDFRTAVELVQTVFGERALRRYLPGGESDHRGAWESRINRALIDVELWGFSPERNEKGLVVKNADAIREAAIELMISPEFSALLTYSTSEKKRVERRFELWKNMLDSVLKNQDQGARAFSRTTKEDAFKTDPTCAICSQKIQSIDDAHMDHMIPFSKGGSTTWDNAALTHRYCNLHKSDGTPSA